MKRLLTGVCCLILGVMLYVTISASLHQDVVSAPQRLWPDPWFRATLADAYCGFLFYWLWVAWREQSIKKKCPVVRPEHDPGNIATAVYLLL